MSTDDEPTTTGPAPGPNAPDAAPDAKAPDANADAKRGGAKPGDVKDGDAKDGDAKDGDAKDGDAKDGDAKDGDAKDGDDEVQRSTGGDVARAMAVGLKDAGTPVVRFLDLIGGHLLLLGRALAWLPRRPFRGKNYLEAAEYIGFGSLPIVLLVGAFTGMVLSLQSVHAFRQFGLESFSGATTGKALAIELAPVLTSLMLAGRAGAGIATELGTMRISEQIDALESMAVNPVQYLVLPRLIAGMLVTPILTLLFFIIGMGGAYLVAVLVEGVPQGAWVANVRTVVVPMDVVQGLMKGVAFGLMITLIGCYQGYHAQGGGRGVGIGTTRAVVLGSVSTLVVDYFLSDVLLSIFGSGREGL